MTRVVSPEFYQAVEGLLELDSQGVLVNYLSRMILMILAHLRSMMLMFLILNGGGPSSLFKEFLCYKSSHYC